MERRNRHAGRRGGGQQDVDGGARGRRGRHYRGQGEGKKEERQKKKKKAENGGGTGKRPNKERDSCKGGGETAIRWRTGRG